jgi:hypothetical protein
MEEAPSHRNFPRYACEGAAEILQNGKLYGWGTVGEISRSGCYIETSHPLPITTEAQVRLTIGDILLDLVAKVAWTTPQVGMGMYFEVVPPEEENKLAQILRKVTGLAPPPAVQQLERPQPTSSAPIRITREAAPGILAKIVERINAKGVLTRQELIDIVKTAS